MGLRWGVSPNLAFIDVVVMRSLSLTVTRFSSLLRVPRFLTITNSNRRATLSDSHEVHHSTLAKWSPSRVLITRAPLGEVKLSTPIHTMPISDAFFVVTQVSRTLPIDSHIFIGNVSITDADRAPRVRKLVSHLPLSNTLIRVTPS